MWCNERYDKYYAMHIIVVVLQGCVHYSPMHILSFVFLVVFFVMVICAEEAIFVSLSGHAEEERQTISRLSFYPLAIHQNVLEF